MRRIALACLLVLGCVRLGPQEMRLEGERTLAACGERRVDPSTCLSVEVIQAEYDLCLRQHPGESRCDEVWEALTRLAAPAPLPPPPLFQRGFRGPP
jgi:hypothetical protein